MSKIESRELKGSNSSAANLINGNQLFLHIEHYPDDINQRRFQELYQEHCDELIYKELNIERSTIACSRPNNISNHVTKTKLYQTQGQTT